MTARQRPRRRGNSEGSIYRLADGRWRGSVFLGYRDGKPHRKYVTRRTRAEAAREVTKLVDLQRQGRLVTTGRITVAEWLATYLDQVARPKVRPRTLDRYQGDISRHIVPAIGRHRLDQLRPAHLLALYNAKAAEGLSGASLRHIHAVIRRALNVAVKWQLIGVNPANLVDAPRPAQHEVVPLSATEARKLLRAAEGDRMEARWLIGLAPRPAPGRSARPVVARRRPGRPLDPRAPGIAAPERYRAGFYRTQDRPQQAHDSAARSDRGSLPRSPGTPGPRTHH